MKPNTIVILACFTEDSSQKYVLDTLRKEVSEKLTICPGEFNSLFLRQGLWGVLFTVSFGSGSQVNGRSLKSLDKKAKKVYVTVVKIFPFLTITR